VRPLFYSGTEVVAANLPDDARLVLPPAIGAGVGDVKAAVTRALEQPVEGESLADRVTERSRVLLVFDGPTFPVPPLRVDPRLAAIEAILEALVRRGVQLDGVSALCASGVTRMYQPTEIARLAGVPALENRPAVCHDAEAIDQFVELGRTTEGEPIELNAALTRTDLVITLAVAQAPIQGGWTTLLPGLASVVTARTFLSAKNLAEGPTPFEPGSRLQKALRRAGKVLEKMIPLFHVELGLDTRLWPKAVINLLRPEGEMPGAISAWDRIPEAIRARASRLFHSEYQTVAVAAGPVGAAHEAVAKVLRERCYTLVEEQADVAVVGVPAVAPHTLGTYDNPVLDVTSAFGYVLAWHTGKPLVKKGGSVILLTPLQERFDRRTHLPYIEFWERVLSQTREPAEMAERFEGYFSGRPEYVSAYRRRFAYHGLQPFHAWYQAWNVLSKVGQVWVVGAQHTTAERFGFKTAIDLGAALASARERSGGKEASIAAMVLPPAFGVAIGR
jgi:hypothetical protein